MCDAAVSHEWAGPDGRTARYDPLDALLPAKPPLAVAPGTDTYVGRALAPFLHRGGQPMAPRSDERRRLLVPSFVGAADFGPAGEALSREKLENGAPVLQQAYRAYERLRGFRATLAAKTVSPPQRSGIALASARGIWRI